MEEKCGLFYFYGYTRYVILLLSLLTLIFAFSNPLVFTFTVICMDDVTDDWLQSPTQINSLFSAVGIGCLIGTLPISYFIQRFGVGKTCSIYGAISAIATFLFPTCVHLGFVAVFICRVVQGIPTSLSYPATGQISSQWSTEAGLGLFISILSSYMQLCSVLTMPISGAFCISSLGWRGSYYFHGVVSLIIFIIFYTFYCDVPAKHRNVSIKEAEIISKGRHQLSTEKRVPYRAILADPCTWSIWISIFGSITSYQTFFLYGPTYLNKVVGLNVRSTGWSTAIPYLLSAIVKLILGQVADKASCISQRSRLILFTFISHGCSAICLIILALTSSPIIAQAAFTGFIITNGIIAVGSFRGASMVFRQHVHFVMAVCSFLMLTVIFTFPVIVAYACPNSSPEEWSRLFLAIAVFVIVSSLPYGFFAKESPAKCIIGQGGICIKKEICQEKLSIT